MVLNSFIYMLIRVYMKRFQTDYIFLNKFFRQNM